MFFALTTLATANIEFFLSGATAALALYTGTKIPKKMWR